MEPAPLSWGAQLVTAPRFTPYSALFPGPASPSGSGGSAPPQEGRWEGAPPAEAAWAEDVRHGERGQREGGGTWNPRPVAGSPGSKISKEEWGRGTHTSEGLGCAPPVAGWEMGLRSVLSSPPPTVFGA